MKKPKKKKHKSVVEPRLNSIIHKVSMGCGWREEASSRVLENYALLSRNDPKGVIQEF